jgi:hypothetical protein
MVCVAMFKYKVPRTEGGIAGDNLLINLAILCYEHAVYFLPTRQSWRNNPMTGKDTAEPMNKEMIEEKDQFLLKRSREILKNRKILRKEELIRKKESKMRSVLRRPGFWLLILCAGGIMTGLMIFRKPSPMVASNRSEQRSEAAVEESKIMVATKLADPVALSDTEETPPSMAVLQPEKEAVPQQDAALVVEDILIPEVPAETRDRVQPGPTEQTHIPSDIQISEIVSCSSIIKRQYGAPQKVFSLNQDATASIWMNVVSDEPPFTLTHVYYVNGSRYCEVPLEIRYKSMRTWSHVTLGHQARIGEWRVEVITDKGEKLDQIEFTVVP